MNYHDLPPEKREAFDYWINAEGGEMLHGVWYPAGETLERQNPATFEEKLSQFLEEFEEEPFQV